MATMNPAHPTAESMRARCRPAGDCLLWQGPMSGTVPQVRSAGAYASCRRFVLQLAGVAIPNGYSPIAWCRENRCIAQAHIRLLTVQQIGELAAREGKFSTQQRRAAIAQGKRSSASAKLDLSKVDDIKRSATAAEAARKHGIHKSLASRIRNGEAGLTLKR